MSDLSLIPTIFIFPERTMWCFGSLIIELMSSFFPLFDFVDMSVSVAKGRAYEDLYQHLSMKEGEKDIYRMARVRERKTRDFNQVKWINDEREHLLVKEVGIRHRWQEYFDKLFNGENTDITFQLNDSFDAPIGALCGGFKNLRSERR